MSRFPSAAREPSEDDWAEYQQIEAEEQWEAERVRRRLPYNAENPGCALDDTPEETTP